MGKIGFSRNCFFEEEDNDYKKEELIKEFSDYVRNFIKTGVPNNQLEKLIAVEQKFQESFEKQFHIQEIVVQVVEISTKKMLELLTEQSQQSKKLNVGFSEVKEISNYISEEVSKKISDEFIGMISDNLFNISYLSHMNMLYELYEKEAKVRREEKEFEKIAQRDSGMIDVIYKLNLKRRMTLDELEGVSAFTTDGLEMLLTDYREYFNVYNKQNGVQISLSPKGKRFDNYSKNLQQKYSNEAVEQLIYKNCANLLDAVEDCCDWAFASHIEFENISADKERALQSKYNHLIKKLKSNRDMDYIVADIIPKKERERGKNEIRTIRINAGWEQEDY